MAVWRSVCRTLPLSLRAGQCLRVGQFSMQISPESGSVLSANQHTWPPKQGSAQQLELSTYKAQENNLLFVVKYDNLSEWEEHSHKNNTFRLVD